MSISLSELLNDYNAVKIRQWLVKATDVLIRITVSTETKKTLVEKSIPIRFWKLGPDKLKLGTHENHVLVEENLIFVFLNGLTYLITGNDMRMYKNLPSKWKAFWRINHLAKFAYELCKVDFTLTFIESGPTGLFHEEEYKDIFNEYFQAPFRVTFRTDKCTYIFEFANYTIKVNGYKITIRDLSKLNARLNFRLERDVLNLNYCKHSDRFDDTRYSTGLHLKVVDGKVNRTSYNHVLKYVKHDTSIPPSYKYEEDEEIAYEIEEEIRKDPEAEDEIVVNERDQESEENLLGIDFEEC